MHFYNKEKDAKENETQTIPETYGLKSLNCPPQVKELVQFESNILDMIKSLKFQKQEAIFKGDWRMTQTLSIAQIQH